jgi:uncharacterized membrane protein YtjA (UPF0391 family)
MLRTASLFLVAALSAALLGFSRMGLSEKIVDMAQLLFFIFFILFLVFLMAGIVQQSRKAGGDNGK